MRIRWTKAIFAVLIIGCPLAWGTYSIIIYPYSIEPQQDRQFLEAKPTESQILDHFGTPDERIAADERFRQTGWYPLPEQTASYTGYSFTRRCGNKIYIFISTNHTLEAYVISRS